MDELEKAYEKLLGRKPTEDEIGKLDRVQRALGLRHDDALWLVFIALQTYETHYEKIPGEISQAVRSILGDIRSAADAETRASVEAVQAQLAKAVAIVAGKVAKDTAASEKAKWRTKLAQAAGIALLVFVGSFWFTFHIGERAGAATGYEKRSQEVDAQKAAESWTNTPEGQKALWLSKRDLIAPAYAMATYHEQLQAIFSCKGKGWVIGEDGLCIVRPFMNNEGKEETVGWHIPVPGDRAPTF